MFDEAFVNKLRVMGNQRVTGIRTDLISAVLNELGYFNIDLTQQKTSRGQSKGLLRNISQGSDTLTLLCAEVLFSLDGMALGAKGNKATLIVHTDGMVYNIYDIEKGTVGHIIFSIDFNDCYDDELDLFSDLSIGGSIKAFIFNVKKRKIAQFLLMNYINPDKESFEYIADRLGIPNSYDFKLEVLRVLAPYTEDKSQKNKKSLIDTDTSAPITNVSFDIEDVLKELEGNGLCYYPDSTYKTGYRLTTPDTIIYGATEFEFKTWRDCVVRILQCAVETNKFVAKKLSRLRVGMTLNFFATQQEVENFCNDLNYKNGEQGIKQVEEDLYVYVWGNPTMAVTSLYSILLKAGVDLSSLRFEYLM